MIYRMTIKNDGTPDEPSWTLEDQDGHWLDDSEDFMEMINRAKVFGDTHGIHEVTINMEGLQCQD